MEKRWVEPPCFPLAGLMLLIRSHPVRPPGCVCVCVCVCTCACARECTRGGLVFARVYAWWSRGPPECYSITKGQRLERRQTIGPKRPTVVTSWSPHDHPMITSWSPRGRLMVASWSPRGRLVVASWSHIWRPPPSLIGFFEAYAGPIWGDSGEVTRIYTSRDI